MLDARFQRAETIGHFVYRHLMFPSDIVLRMLDFDSEMVAFLTSRIPSVEIVYVTNREYLFCLVGPYEWMGFDKLDCTECDRRIG